MNRNRSNNARGDWQRNSRGRGQSSNLDCLRRTDGLQGNGQPRGFPFKRNDGRNNKFARNSNELPDEEFIDDLLNKTPEDVENLISATQRFVKIIHSDLSEDLVVKILKLVAQVCDSTTVNDKNYIVKVTMQQKFAKRINSFLSLLISDDKSPKFWEALNETLGNMATVLENALNLMPMSMWDLVKPILKNIEIVLPVLINEKQVIISPLINEKFASLQEVFNKIGKIFENPENEGDNIDQNGSEYEKDPDSNFRTISVYPDVTELIIPDRSYMRKNIVDRPYLSVAQYLDIHFRLLREDFVNSIREDVCAFLNKSNRRLFNIKIHRNVKFVERVVYKDSRCFNIQFNIPEWISKSIDKGEQQKRLIHGTLLLFSDDNFNTMLYGKVISSDKLRDGSLLVDVPRRHNNNPDFEKSYLMIECVVFFEPYYQVLSVLQKLGRGPLPMEDNIVKINKETRRPKYLETVASIQNVPGLNPSQDAALNAAMSKEFVIIQGPPGTGKTFLGMKIVAEILKQREYWQSQGPILIICFTNHALDQFLQGLGEYTGKIARLGGQSNNMKQIESKYGPEAKVYNVVRQILQRKGWSYFDFLSHDDNDIRMDGMGQRLSFTQIYETTLQILRKGPPYDRNHYSSWCQEMVDSVSQETKQWMMEKGRLNRIFFELKSLEREINEKKRFTDTLNDIKCFGIFKTALLFEQNNMYYYFTDFELACWLLCDDGTVSTNLDTLDTIGLTHSPHHQERHKIYNLLSDCVSERDTAHGGGQFFITIAKLKQLAHELDEQFQVHRYDQLLQEYLTFVRSKIDYLQICLNQEFKPPDLDPSCSNTNPWNLSSKSRWQLYHHWIQVRRTSMHRDLEHEMNLYQFMFANYNLLREHDNIKFLQKMNIVGMTTTCAARMRSTIEALRSPVVVVEEAAEVLESHIVTALTSNCQHLILLGDHQQLRPTTSDYTVEKKYKLGISLFERMVCNDVQCHTLNVQHRMRPEISKLLVPTFYKDLKDSDSVKNYPTVTGVKSPIFFIDHTEPEEPYGDSSKMNTHEAKYLIQLAIYLLNNDYKPEEITILAAYLGQTYTLKEERNKSKHPLINRVCITQVDNFQGEENRIILLSLVRSNVDNSIGFLSVDNRVCVALSRAREGFYIMGNMKQLCTSSQIWNPIKASLESQDAIGRHLALGCRNHKENVTFASKASDFAKVPEGGCTLPCNTKFACTHQCTKKCHGYDVDHENYQCMELCKKSICDIPEHKCKKKCYEMCGLCNYPVTKTLVCGHTKTVNCSTDIEAVRCEFLIEIEPACKHLQQVPCHTVEDFICKTMIEKELSCGHKRMVQCKFHHDIYKLNEKANKVAGRLSELKIHSDDSSDESSTENLIKSVEEEVCTTQCTQVLKCGHLCRLKCHKNDDPEHLKYQCLEPCTKNKVGCRHPDIHPKCDLRCGESCATCIMHVMSSGTCSHFNKVECYKESRTRCTKKCNKMLPCGHACRKRCFETCENRCEQDTFKVIPACGHKIKVSCYETPSQKNCREKCDKVLACGHDCMNLCMEECTEKCMKICSKVLECGHKCISRCSQPCACKMARYPDCTHIGKIKCGEILKQEDCRCSSRRRIVIRKI